MLTRDDVLDVKFKLGKRLNHSAILTPPRGTVSHEGYNGACHQISSRSVALSQRNAGFGMQNRKNGIGSEHVLKLGTFGYA